MEISGLPVVVTGGGSGLGAGTARAFAAVGARVAVFDVNRAGAEAVAAEIGGIAAACDVADEASAAAAFAAARAAHGPCAVLVNCAGVATATLLLGPDGPIPLAEIERIIRINLLGTINMMRLAAAEMAIRDPDHEGERGVIVNTASVSAYDGAVGQTAYAASKGGVAALVLPAARELARNGIRVLAIAPGLFETPMAMSMPDRVRGRIADTLMFPKRLGTPADYARLAIHMVENVLLNGEVVRLDSAMRMPPR